MYCSAENTNEDDCKENFGDLKRVQKDKKREGGAEGLESHFTSGHLA